MECRAPSDAQFVPEAPSGLVAIDNETKLSLNWSDNAVSDLVLNYKVYRAPAEGGPYTLLSSPVASAYDDSTGVSGTLYWYRVTAVNAVGESPYSAVSGSRTNDTTAPGNVTISSTQVVGATSVQISWTPPTDSDLKGFFVYRSTSLGGTYTKISGATALSVNSFTDVNATAGATWYYKVTSIDNAGNESTGSLTNIAVPASDTTPPAVPTGVAAVDSGTGILTSWTPNTEPDLAGYFIYRSDDGYTASLTGTTLITASQYNDTTAVLGTAYSYKVVAKDTTGNVSAKSTASNAVTRPTSPTGDEDLTPFVYKSSTMVPCCVHTRCVNEREFTTSQNQTTKVYTIVTTDKNDFPAIKAGTQLTTKYLMNFAAGSGNPQGRFPTLQGFNGAHAYDVAGTYQVRLDITYSDGSTRKMSTMVTLAADTRQKCYVSASGDTSSTNNGTDITKPVALSRAQALAGSTSKLRIMLRNGDTFSWSAQTAIFTLTQSDQMVSNYSDPAKPSTTKPVVLFTTAPSTFRSWIILKGQNGIVENLQFNCNYAGAPSKNDTAVDIQARGCLVRNNSFVNIGYPVKGLEGVTDTNNKTRYTLILDNDCPNPIRGNFWFYTAVDGVLLNNSMVDSTDEHCIRMSSAVRLLAAYNTMKNVSGTSTVKASFNIQFGYDFYGVGNVASAIPLSTQSQTLGSNQLGPLGAAGSGFIEEFFQYLVWERNECFGQLLVVNGLFDAMLRNNVVHKDEAQNLHVDGKGSSSVLDTWGRAYNTRVNQRVYIYNNTFINNGKGGNMFANDSTFTGFEYKNNLNVAPNLLAGSTYSMLLSSGVGSGWLIDRNVYPPSNNNFKVGSTVETVTNFNKRTGVTNNLVENPVLNTSFKVPNASQSKTQGRPIAGVWEDFYGTARSSGASSWCVGAVEGGY